MSLQSQILLVETAETRATAVDALATGLSVHKQMSAKMFQNVQLDKLQDDLLEQACFEAEVSNLMGQSFEAATTFDDETNANLDRALEELQGEEINAVMLLHAPETTDMDQAVARIMDAATPKEVWSADNLHESGHDLSTVELTEVALVSAESFPRVNLSPERVKREVSDSDKEELRPAGFPLGGDYRIWQG